MIWKEALQFLDVQEVNIPEGAEILCAKEQFENICIWFRCDPAAPKVARTIAIVGTGNPVPSADGRYLGTAALAGGSLIFHVFERLAVS